MLSENINRFIDQFVNDPAFRNSLKDGIENWEQVLQAHGHQLTEEEKQQLGGLLEDVKGFCNATPAC